ncbi:MAG: lactonase family protein [Gemmataceae bacterium]
MSLSRSLLILLLLFAVSPDVVGAEGKFWVYIGSNGKEIYKLEFDANTGTLTSKGIAAETPRPSFLAIHPTKRFLYAVGEVNTLNGKKGGGVVAYSLNPATGDLVKLNEQSSVGAGPCHVVVDAAGKNVLAANYGGGSVCVLPIQPDGKLGEASAFIQHTGSSVNPSRQKEPHAHSVNLDPANKFAFVADLGLDKVIAYRFDPAKGTLAAGDAYETAKGAGPRHFAFHPDGKHAFVINELDSTLDAMNFDPTTGKLTRTDSIKTLPGDFKGNSTTAEVQVHPSGKFVYGSNRGHDSIAAFAFDSATGRLKPIGHATEGIKTPRNFAVDPTGRFALVANQDGDSVLVFRIDPKTGALSPTDQKVVAKKPVCVKFVPIP